MTTAPETLATSYDIVVVGAGPAGCAVAFEAARLGCGRVLLLEKAGPGRAKTCGSGISPRARKALKGLGLWGEVEREAYPIRGLRLVSPSGREVTLAGSETASVLVRSRFDAILAGAARRAGAEVRCGAPVEGLVAANGRVTGVTCGGEEVHARWVIVANGALSRLHQDHRPRRLLHTCMAWFDGVPFTPGILEMVYDPVLLPHYGWLFPESETRVNVGVCLFAENLGRRSIRDVFGTFLEKHYGGRLAGAAQVGPWRGHPISPTVAVEHEAPPGVLVAGEANRLTNIATGEGIAYAIESGVLAARAIAEGDRAGWEPERTAARYRSDLRRAFSTGFRVADLFTRHGTRLLDAVTALGNLGPVRFLTGRGLARL